MDETYNDRYYDWVEKNQPLFRKICLHSIPSRSTFLQRRQTHHPYVNHTPTNDWSNCADHFNFLQKHHALQVLSKIRSFIHVTTPSLQHIHHASSVLLRNANVLQNVNTVFKLQKYSVRDLQVSSNVFVAKTMRNYQDMHVHQVLVM